MKLPFRKKISQIAKGKLIVIDGIDGSGKTTQQELLKKELEANRFQVETIHFPRHGEPTAFMIDKYLKGDYGDIGAYAAAVLYATDRFDAAAQIKQWLNEGKIVLSDRYVTANAGHQGSKIQDSTERLKFFKWLDNLEFNVFNLPKPDINIILNMPYMVAYKFLNSRKDNGIQKDIHENNLTHLRLAEKVFFEISRLFPNTKLVDCVQGKQILDTQDIHNKIWELVRRIVLKDIKN